jgi:predicted ester cyclase
MSAPDSQLERNKSAVRRFKEAQGTKDEGAMLREVLAPNYTRLRGGMANLAANARDQGFPEPRAFLRSAFPDRVDVIEDIIAEDDRVGLLWRLTGTHQGNLFGIPPTGRRVDIHELGIFRLADGRITEGWFLADELGLLKQLGLQMPPRRDGSLVVPPVTDAGEDGDVVVKRLMAGSLAAPEQRNKLKVARSKSSFARKEDRARFVQRRWGLQHLREYGEANGVMQFDPSHAFPGRNDRILDLMAEGNKVWMQFNLRGTNTQSFYGLPPTGRRCEMAEVGIATFAGDEWIEGWYLADGVGILLQLGALDLLAALGCKPLN